MDNFFPWLQDPDVRARLGELRGRIVGCISDGSIINDRCTRCPKSESESDNHVPAWDDIFHVVESFDKAGYVCLKSGCKSSHRKKGNFYSSDDIILNLRISSEAMSSPKKEDVTNKIDQEVIRTKLPTQEDITHKCHHCETEFKEKTSFISHMKSIHNAEDSTAVKSESKPVNSDDRNLETADEKNIIDMKNIHNAENSISEEDKETSFKEDITIKCRICEKKLNNDRLLKSHMENAHNTFSIKSENPTAVKIKNENQEVAEMIKPENKIKCHICEKGFKNNISLKIHMKNVHNTVSVKSENPTTVKIKNENQEVAEMENAHNTFSIKSCLLYTSPSPRD